VSTAEREIKFAPPAGFQLPSLTDPGGGVFASPETSTTLTATYYDTPDLRITRSGASLRYRDPEGWTVKLPLPGDNGGRDDEVLVRNEHYLTGDPGSPPAAALDLVQSRTRGATVAAVAILRSARATVVLHDAQGAKLGEVVNDDVEATFPDSDAGPDSDPGPDSDQVAASVRFGEVELELGAGCTQAHRLAVTARLGSAGLGLVDPTPKVVRALGDAAARPGDVEVLELGEGFPSIDDVVHRAVASSVDRLITYDPTARLGEDPEGVHQARVATRRLRSDLRTFRSLLDERWAAELSDELRWLGDVFGAVRDADVLLERLDTKLVELPEVDREPAKRLLDRLRTDHERGRDQMLGALRSDRYDALLNRVVVAAARPCFLPRVGDTDDAEILSRLARRPWKHLAAAVAALADNPSDLALHGVRIRAKRARYAAEAVAPAFGKPARAFARAVTELQDVLGEHQDAIVAAEWLRRAATGTADESTGFAAGQLAAIEYRQVERARRAWPKAWRRASRKRLRSWL